ncbi:MAG TPA: NAD(P)-binding protein, partial [Solirubrobacteraceae bacterium]|nr:NAD(P)-binding protein [Solirubrobacteraceae bacterium]
MTDALSDHIIVCGFGALGRAVARELQDAEARYVAIGGQEGAGAASILGIPFVGGEPSDPASLHAAGIERARALVACSGSDAEDLATTRAARELRADLPIAACHSGEESHKLTRAG